SLPVVRASATRDDLPIPGSPSTQTTAPSPRPSTSIPACRIASSCLRPTHCGDRSIGHMAVTYALPRGFLQAATARARHPCAQPDPFGIIGGLVPNDQVSRSAAGCLLPDAGPAAVVGGPAVSIQGGGRAAGRDNARDRLPRPLARRPLPWGYRLSGL